MLKKLALWFPILTTLEAFAWFDLEHTIEEACSSSSQFSRALRSELSLKHLKCGFEKVEQSSEFRTIGDATITQIVSDCVNSQTNEKQVRIKIQYEVFLPDPMHSSLAAIEGMPRVSLDPTK